MYRHRYIAIAAVTVSNFDSIYDHKFPSIVAVSSAVNALRVIVVELPCWLLNDSRLDIIVASSGASTMDTPSYCPNVKYVSTNFPPAFSILFLKVSERFGESFTVLIPCSVNFHRIMK